MPPRRPVTPARVPPREGVASASFAAAIASSTVSTLRRSDSRAARAGAGPRRSQTQTARRIDRVVNRAARVAQVASHVARRGSRPWQPPCGASWVNDEARVRGVAATTSRSIRPARRRREAAACDWTRGHYARERVRVAREFRRIPAYGDVDVLSLSGRESGADASRRSSGLGAATTTGPQLREGHRKYERHRFRAPRGVRERRPRNSFANLATSSASAGRALGRAHASRAAARASLRRPSPIGRCSAPRGAPAACLGLGAERREGAVLCARRGADVRGDVEALGAQPSEPRRAIGSSATSSEKGDGLRAEPIASSRRVRAVVDSVVPGSMASWRRRRIVVVSTASPSMPRRERRRVAPPRAAAGRSSSPCSVTPRRRAPRRRLARSGLARPAAPRARRRRRAPSTGAADRPNSVAPCARVALKRVVDVGSRRCSTRSPTASRSAARRASANRAGCARASVLEARVPVALFERPVTHRLRWRRAATARRGRRRTWRRAPASSSARGAKRARNSRLAGCGRF